MVRIKMVRLKPSAVFSSVFSSVFSATFSAASSVVSSPVSSAVCSVLCSLVFILAISVCALAGPTPISNPLPDTGQTQSYPDIFGEDADYTIKPPSYIKLDEAGNPLSDSAPSWSMVKDNVTGLIWENKTADGSIHNNKKYTWSNAQNSFIADLNSTHFGGFSDWRLPTVKELALIVNRGKYSPAIDPAYFPNTLSDFYWSSTAAPAGAPAPYPLYAWCVNFNYGGVSGRLKAGTNYVRAVRGGK